MKNKVITDFLIKMIKRTEKSIIENHGAIPFDFDKLVRYHTLVKLIIVSEIMMLHLIYF